MIHSAGGGPIDSSFSYFTEEWIPSNKSFDETYDFRMNMDSKHILNELKQLNGVWKNTNTDSEHYEVWSANADKILGKGFALNGQDTIFQEYLNFNIKNDLLYLSSRVPNQNNGQTIDFKWVYSYHDQHVFSNPQHDFPQIISYKVSQDTVHAEIRGTIDQNEQKSQFSFVRQSK